MEGEDTVGMFCKTYKMSTRFVKENYDKTIVNLVGIAGNESDKGKMEMGVQ